MEAAKRRNDLALVADLQYEAIPAVKKRIQVQFFELCQMFFIFVPFSW